LQAGDPERIEKSQVERSLGEYTTNKWHARCIIGALFLPAIPWYIWPLWAGDWTEAALGLSLAAQLGLAFLAAGPITEWLARREMRTLKRKMPNIFPPFD
jgi:hypothetical protein